MTVTLRISVVKYYTLSTVSNIIQRDHLFNMRKPSDITVNNITFSSQHTMT